MTTRLRAALALALLFVVGCVQPPAPPAPPHIVASGPVSRPAGPSDAINVVGQYNGLASGLDTSGVVDCAAALQTLLNKARDAGGGTVLLPVGRYNLASTATTTLIIPTNVALVGSYQGSLSHNGFRDGAPFPTGGGTVLLMPVGGTVAYTSPYIQVNSLNGANACLKGCYLYAPSQSATAATPTSCPPWIAIRGKNGSVIDCEGINPYWFIDINNPSDAAVTERATVERVTGQPLFMGISIGDQGHNGIADIPRLIDIHFNPFWVALTAGPAIWAQANGTAFKVGDVDEIIMRGCFAYGYNIGFWGVLGAVSGGGIIARGPYGSIVGGGFDICNTCVQVDVSQAQAALRFEAFGFSSGGGSTKIGIVANAGAGPISVVGCDFWGNGPNSAAQLASTANTTSFSACHFNIYSGGAIRISSGQVIVSGCNFKLNNAGGGAAIAQSGSGVATAIGNLQKTAFTTTGTIANTAANGSF